MAEIYKGLDINPEHINEYLGELYVAQLIELIKLKKD